MDTKILGEEGNSGHLSHEYQKSKFISILKMKNSSVWEVYLLGSHGNGSVQKYSASSASLAGILYGREIK